MILINKTIKRYSMHHSTPNRSRHSRLLALLFSFCTLLLPPVSNAGPAEAILHALDYIAVDYPPTVADGAVLDQNEYTEQVEFSAQLLPALERLPAKNGREKIAQQLGQLENQIRTRAEGSLVAQTARDAARRIAELYQLNLTPRAVPDLALGARLFHGKCVSCHGKEGFGDGPTAARLDPPPINFHDRDRAMERSVYGLYSAISFGVEGTKMRAFDQLSEGQRWALAFYVSNFAFSDDERASGEKIWQQQPAPALTTIEALSNATPSAVVTQHGQQGLAQLAYLRAHPEKVMKAVSPIDTAIEKLGSAMASYRSGDHAQAYQEAVSAYLDGFELAEPGLRANQPQRLKMLEEQMMRFRQQIKTGAPAAEVESHYHALVQALEQTRDGGENIKISAEAGMISAAVILLREGLEAILILAAIAGVLIKTGRRDAMIYLHAGWVSALLLGGVTWAVSTYFITIGGSNREITEGLTALLATAVLLYVGFWLHGKTNAVRWREFVDSKIKGALQGKALWALTAVAFLAVYREIFETVLFYQALWMQVAPADHFALWGGIGAGMGALLLLGWLLLKFSVRLPLKLFFNINSFILFVLAVAFAGNGVRALQEAGVIGVSSLKLPEVELLGLYPTLETTLLQLTVAGLVIAMLLRERFQGRGQRPAVAKH